LLGTPDSNYMVEHFLYYENDIIFIFRG